MLLTNTYDVPMYNKKIKKNNLTNELNNYCVHAYHDRKSGYC